MGITEATPIQEQAIPVILEGKDIIGCAQTGTGKTGAFLLPILHKMEKEADGKNIQVVILSPTRELAKQIDQQVEAFGYYCGVSSIPVYGGGDANLFEKERTALTSGVEIVVATPGRLKSHMNLGYVDTSKLSVFILDEADRMLDMGFYEDIITISKDFPASCQRLLFSATMPGKIRQLATKLLKNPTEVNISISKTASGVTQLAYLAHDKQKIATLQDILKDGKYESMIIFCSRKTEVKEAYHALKKIGLKVKPFHSDLDQEERQETLLEFKNKKLTALVATDIISRGIDIEDIDLVVNLHVPKDAADYVHRVGRTARASSKGTAITFICKEDQYNFSKIEKLIEKEVPKLTPPETLGDYPKYEPFTKSKSKQHTSQKPSNRSSNNSPKRTFKKRANLKPRPDETSPAKPQVKKEESSSEVKSQIKPSKFRKRENLKP